MKKIKIKSIENKTNYQIWIDEIEQKQVTKVKINELTPGDLPEIEITYITDDLEIELETEENKIIEVKE